jgi:type III secretion protein D
LLDPAIEAQHARLRPAGGGWVLTPLDGEILGADTNQALDSLELSPGDFCRIGRVWMAIVDEGAAWTAPPEEPVDIAPEELESGHDETDNAQAGIVDADNNAAAGPDKDPDAAASDRPGETAVPARTGPAQQREAPEVAGRRKWSRPQLVLGSLVVLTVLAAFAAWMFAGVGPDTVPFKPGVSTAARDTPPKAPAPPALTQEELRAAFRKRLAEVDLLKRFDLNLRDNAWHMQAALDDEEAARFERTLTGFVAQHKLTFPIHAKVGNAEHMLPFKIRQVISGANASIVTLDGVRIYVGDEYQGVRLLAVQGSRLTFAGKRKIEVRW